MRLFTERVVLNVEFALNLVSLVIRESKMSDSASRLSENLEYINQLVYALRLNELQQILEGVKQNISGSRTCLQTHIFKLLNAPLQHTKDLRLKIIRAYNCRSQQDRQLQPASRASVVQQLNFRLPQLQILSKSHKPSPAMQFQNLPFFKTIQTLLMPIRIQKKSDSVNFTGLFYLTDGISQAIARSWDSSRREYKIQIILRFLQLGLKENDTQRLPYNITVKVNGRDCELPAVNVPTHISITPWQRNDPIDITSQTDLRKGTKKNTLEITWEDEKHEYMSAVYVAHKLTCDDLLETLKKRPLRASDITKELIKKSMENDADMGVDFILTTIMDPLSRLRLKLPVRGVDCVHLQCFDAIQFLQMNEHKQTWACPICMKKTKFENIEVDDFFLNILQSPDLSKECENIVLFKDGTWSEKKNKEFSTNSKTKYDHQSTKNKEVLTLSDSDKNIPKPKRFKYNQKKVEESVMNSKHIVETNIVTKPSKSNLVLNSGHKNNSTPSVSNSSRYGLKSKFNNGSDQSISGISGNNRHQKEDKPRSVLCVITLD